jgi:hypothetical protein
MVFRVAPQMPFDTHVGLPELEREFMIAATRAHLKRQWIFRSSLVLGLTSAVLVFLVVVRADRMITNGVEHSLGRTVTALQGDVDRLGQLPAVLPEGSSALVYANGLTREYARTTTGPVIVSWTGLYSLTLRSSGYGVVVYQGGKVRHAWLTATEFARERRAQEDRVQSWDEQRRSAPPVLP